MFWTGCTSSSSRLHLCSVWIRFCERYHHGHVFPCRRSMCLPNRENESQLCRRESSGTHQGSQCCGTDASDAECPNHEVIKGPDVNKTFTVHLLLPNAVSQLFYSHCRERNLANPDLRHMIPSSPTLHTWISACFNHQMRVNQALLRSFPNHTIKTYMLLTFGCLFTWQRS